MEKEDVRDVILETVVASLEAQLRAVKRLRTPAEEEEFREKGMSQVDMVHDILCRAKRSLHITQIIDDVEKIHGVKLERESIVSALSKKVLKDDRFVRTDKNTFALRGGDV